MASSEGGEIQHIAPAQQVDAPSSEKPADIDVANRDEESASMNNIETTSTNQYTLISQLWTWMTGTDTTSTTSSSTPPSDTSSPHDANEKTSHYHNTHEPPSSAKEALQCIIDEPREPGFKYKGSAPSRGTHCDYPATRDALWTGGGNRAVPDGLRKLAAGEGDQGPTPPDGGESGSGGRDGDEGDNRDDELEGGKDEVPAREAERVQLKYKGVGNRRKPKHRPGV